MTTNLWERKQINKKRDQKRFKARLVKWQRGERYETLVDEDDYTVTVIPGHKIEAKTNFAIMIRSDTEKKVKSIWTKTDLTALDKLHESLDAVGDSILRLADLTSDENLLFWQQEQLRQESTCLIQKMFLEQASCWELLAAALGLTLQMKEGTVTLNSTYGLRDKKDPDYVRFTIPCDEYFKAWKEQPSVKVVAEWLSLGYSDWQMLLYALHITNSTLTCLTCDLYLGGRPFYHELWSSNVRITHFSVYEALKVNLDYLQNNEPTVIYIEKDDCPGEILANQRYKPIVMIDKASQIKTCENYLDLIIINQDPCFHLPNWERIGLPIFHNCREQSGEV